MDIGIIGLGAMGRAMARNLVAAGHAVTIWNRSGGTVEGARTVATPREALQGDAALTMLADDAAIRAVLLEPGALAQANPGLVHVVASTISVALARELARRHAELGLAYVAAPVLGRPDVAASAQLNILAAGDPAAVRRVEPLFAAIGRQVWDMGTDPAGANAAKIACNMMITMAIEAMAEAVVLSEGHGVGRDRLFDVMLNTLFGCRAYQTYSANIAHDAYEPGFKATLGLKDLAAEAAGEVGGSLPMLEAVHRRMAETVAAGRGAQDWSAMADFTIATATRGR